MALYLVAVLSPLCSSLIKLIPIIMAGPVHHWWSASLRGNFSQSTIYTSAVWLTGALGTGALCICVSVCPCVYVWVCVRGGLSDLVGNSSLGWCAVGCKGDRQRWNMLHRSQVLYVGHALSKQGNSEVWAWHIYCLSYWMYREGEA